MYTIDQVDFVHTIFDVQIMQKVTQDTRLGKGDM